MQSDVSPSSVVVSELTSTGSPWRLYLAEFIGTGLLLLFGLSLVIFMFGDNSPGSQFISNYKLRQMITGFLFGCVGALIAISPLGKISGAHVNPVVTIGFRLMGKMDLKTCAGYILAQFLGAVVGCLPLLLWGPLGESISFGATAPGRSYSTWAAVVGEVITTFALVAALCFFIANRKIRKYTPAMIPFLYSIMVPLEADISGTSTNPARSFGPAVISGQWNDWWVYLVGPAVGMGMAIMLASFFALKIEEARLYHFESDSRRFFGHSKDES